MALGFTSGQSDAAADYQYDTRAEALLNTSDFEVNDVIVINNSTGVWPFNYLAGDYRWNGLELVAYNKDLKDRVIAIESTVDGLSSASHGHPNKSILDAITQPIVDSWNAAALWVTTNGANVLTSLAEKLDKGGYAGNAQDLKDEIDAIQTGGNSGPVDIHDDVDLYQGAIPKNGWIAKYVGGQLTLCMSEFFFYKGPPVINVLEDIPLPSTPITSSFFFQRVGVYKITINVSYSIDSKKESVVIVPKISGLVLANIAGGEMLRHEHSNDKGNDNDGRGTDQKNTATKIYYFNNTTISNKNIKVDHFGTKNGKEAALWDVFISVEEIFTPIIVT